MSTGLLRPDAPVQPTYRTAIKGAGLMPSNELEVPMWLASLAATCARCAARGLDVDRPADDVVEACLRELAGRPESLKAGPDQPIGVHGHALRDAYERSGLVDADGCAPAWLVILGGACRRRAYAEGCASQDARARDLVAECLEAGLAEPLRVLLEASRDSDVLDAFLEAALGRP